MNTMVTDGGKICVPEISAVNLQLSIDQRSIQNHPYKPYKLQLPQDLFKSRQLNCARTKGTQPTSRPSMRSLTLLDFNLKADQP
jgi:hypothetical protein